MVVIVVAVFVVVVVLLVVVVFVAVVVVVVVLFVEVGSFTVISSHRPCFGILLTQALNSSRYSAPLSQMQSDSMQLPKPHALSSTQFSPFLLRRMSLSGTPSEVFQERVSSCSIAFEPAAK